jgi:hypothetical protein
VAQRPALHVRLPRHPPAQRPVRHRIHLIIKLSISKRSYNF